MPQQPTQVNCPYCLNAKGYVRAVRVDQNDQQTLRYVCEACRRSWDGEPQRCDPLRDMLTQTEPRSNDR